MNQTRDGDKLVQRIEWTSGILLAVFTAGAWVVFSTKMAVGVFLGGLISMLSFRVLKWQLKRALMDPRKTPSKGGLFATYYLRYLGTLFLVFVVIYYGWAEPIAFLVGLSVVVFSIVLAGGREFLVLLSEKGEG